MKKLASGMVILAGILWEAWEFLSASLKNVD